LKGAWLKGIGPFASFFFLFHSIACYFTPSMRSLMYLILNDSIRDHVSTLYPVAWSTERMF